MEQSVSDAIFVLKNDYNSSIKEIAQEVLKKVLSKEIRTFDKLNALINEKIDDTDWILKGEKTRLAIFCSENWNWICEGNFRLSIEGNAKIHERINAVSVSPEYLPLDEIASLAMNRDVMECLVALGLSLSSLALEESEEEFLDSEE